MLKGHWKGKDIGTSDIWRFDAASKLGEITPEEFLEAEACMARTQGHCAVIGTASTMAVMVEALGLSLPDNASIPAADARRKVLSQLSGRRIVEMVKEDLTLSKILTRKAFENAIMVNAAIGVPSNRKMRNKNFIFRKIFRGTLVFSFLLILLPSCMQKKQLHSFSNKDISAVITEMSDIMLHDITNPPLAARFFSYTCLAGYEIVSQHDAKCKSMHGILNNYPEIQRPDPVQPGSYQLAVLLAMMETAKKMQPSGKLMEAFEEKFIDSCRKAGFNDEVLNNSKNYALVISGQILAYAKADGYNKISNLPRYTPLTADGYWYPTPPGFMAAVEPNFNTVRPFTLDSPAQFKPAPPIAFNAKTGSPFYALTEAVFKEGNELKEDHRLIASFWDCNPFAIQDGGHLQYGVKKISPGAHWLGITGIACLNGNKDFDETMQIYTSVSIGLMDAFICCWDEKYRSNRVRPETAIRKYIDAQWTPLLQTPPFPEYLSGHSVISSASAIILTHYFGDNFSYTDSVEITYGLPSRAFKSFQQAAEEAAISRFYGGIHFMDAITNGQQQGTKVGEWVLQKIK
jgi:Dehydratase family/PAP2 superfamily